MTKETKKFFLSLIGIFLLVVVIAFATKFSFKIEMDIYKRIGLVPSDKLVYIIDKPVNNYFVENINSLSDLENNSSLIVKVKLLERKLSLNDVESKMEIVKIYKGNDRFKEKDNIYVYEPFSVNGKTVSSTEGYMFMKENTEYVLFLQDLKKIETFKYPKKVENSFLITSPLFSKYSEIDNFTYIDYTKNNNLLYKDIKDFTAIFTKEKDFYLYKELKNQVLSKYK